MNIHPLELLIETMPLSKVLIIAACREEEPLTLRFDPAPDTAPDTDPEPTQAFVTADTEPPVLSPLDISTEGPYPLKYSSISYCGPKTKRSGEP